jgi:hypothetical protein
MFGNHQGRTCNMAKEQGKGKIFFLRKKGY